MNLFEEKPIEDGNKKKKKKKKKVKKLCND